MLINVDSPACRQTGNYFIVFFRRNESINSIFENQLEYYEIIHTSFIGNV